MKRRLLWDGVVYEAVDDVAGAEAKGQVAEVIGTADLVLVATRRLPYGGQIIEEGQPFPAEQPFADQPTEISVFLPPNTSIDSLVSQDLARWVRRRS